MKNLRVQDVTDILDCSESRAYLVIRTLKKGLEKKGYLVMAGRAPRKYFEERTCMNKKIIMAEVCILQYPVNVTILFVMNVLNFDFAVDGIFNK